MLSKDELIELIKTDVNQFNIEIGSYTEGVDLSESDFTSININGAVFNNVDLTSSAFTDSIIVNTKFECCDLSSVDFTRSNIVECSFSESALNGTDFSYAKVDYCNFADADLAGAIFQGADLMNSDFSLSENLNACRFDDDTTWPDNEYLPEDFDSRYSSDLSSLKDDDDDFEQSEY